MITIWTITRRELVRQLMFGLLDVSDRERFRSLTDAMECYYQALGDPKQPLLHWITPGLAYTHTWQRSRDESGHITSAEMRECKRNFQTHRTVKPLIDAGYLEIHTPFPYAIYRPTFRMVADVWAWRGKNKILNPTPNSFNLARRARRDSYFGRKVTSF